MREEKKMSSFTPMTCVDASTNGYSVPVCKEDVGNGLILVRELAGICNAGTIVDAATIEVRNNAFQYLVTSQATPTLNVNCVSDDVPNFAVEIKADTAATLKVTKTVNNVVTELFPSAAGGTSLESGKYYQVTCVGNCWTLAEFVDPNAQRGVLPQEQGESETRSVIEDEPESSGEVNDTAVGDDSGSAVR